MAAVRGKDTKPEMIVRRAAHRLGYRYRVHVAALPGRPDMVFPSRRRIIQIHGCFWHRHPGCRFASTPKARAAYWAAKFQRNVARDARTLAELRARGWEVLVVWECEVRDVHLGERLAAFLGPRGKRAVACYGA